MAVQGNNSIKYTEYSNFLSDISQLCTQANAQFAQSNTPAIKAVVQACLGLNNRVTDWVGCTPPYPIQEDYILTEIVDEITSLDATLAQSFSKLGAEKKIVERQDLPERCAPCGPDVYLPTRELYVSTESATDFTAHAQTLLGATPSNSNPSPSQPTPSSPDNNETPSNLVALSLVPLVAVGVIAIAMKVYRSSQKKAEEKTV